MKSFFTRIISLLFPETCVACNKEGDSLCKTCIQTFPLAPYIEEPWIHCLFSYQDKKVHDTIHAFKFNHVQSIANHVAPLMHETIQDIRAQHLSLKETETITLLSIPKMQAHVHKRGFDAVLHLCKRIAMHDKNKYMVNNDSIVRINTKAQVGLSRQERLLNMRGAFRVMNKDTLNNKTICIIDDVMTTGSTLRELRKVCLEADAKEVFAVTIAH